MARFVDNRVEVRRAKFIGWEFRCIHDGVVIRRAPFDRESWSWRPTRASAFYSGRALLNAAFKEDAKESKEEEFCYT